MNMRALVDNLDRQVDRFYGKYRGLVAENEDPTMRGRIKATVPEVLGTTTSGWAMPCAPYAGPNAGFFAVPPVGAGVWIEFEAGDPSRPIWVGSWWGTGDAPLDNGGGLPTASRKEWRTESGLMVSIDDDATSLTISDATGTNMIVVDVAASTIEVRGGAKLVLEAPLVDHGASASHPAVLGDLLLTYLGQLVTLFNGHVHPGQTVVGIPVTPAPPQAPFTPPQSSLLSTKNMVE